MNTKTMSTRSDKKIRYATEQQIKQMKIRGSLA